MSVAKAQQFVARMRMDQGFREEVRATADTASLREVLRKNGYEFCERELVGAMISCMEEMGRMAPRG